MQSSICVFILSLNFVTEKPCLQEFEIKFMYLRGPGMLSLLHWKCCFVTQNVTLHLEQFAAASSIMCIKEVLYVSFQIDYFFRSS